MDTHGARHLGDPHNGVLHVTCRHHHEVVELVDDDEDERQHLGRLGLFGQVGRVLDGRVVLAQHRRGDVADATAVRDRGRGDQTIGHQLVVTGDVAHAVLGQQVVAALHLLDRPRQRVGGLLGLDDDRVQQVRQLFVLPQLDSLGVDEDHLHLVRVVAHQDRRDDGVHARRLPRARRTRDEDVRHLGQVDHDGPPGDVPAHRHLERVGGAVGLLGLEDVAQGDELARPVRHLDADGRLARDGREDADVGRRHGVGDVLRQAGDARHLDTRAELYLVAGDGRAHPAADEARLDAVRGEGAHQLLPRRVDLALVGAHLLRRVQQRETRQHPAPGRARRRRSRCERGFGAGRRRQLTVGLRHSLGFGFVFGIERDVDVEIPRLGRVGRAACGRPRAGSLRDGCRSRRRARVVCALPLGAQAHEGPAPPERTGRANAPGSPGAQGSAHGGERDAGGDEERDHEEGGKEDGGAAGPQPGVERATHDGSEVPAGVAQLARVVQGRVVPQLRQPAHGEQTEHGADGKPYRIGGAGSLVPGVRFGAAAPEEQGHAGADCDEREEDAGPPGDQGEPRVDAVTDRAEPGSPEGQGEQDAERDETDRPQVAGLHAPERLRATPGRAGPTLRRRSGLGLLGRGARLRRGPCVRTRRGPSASRHHSTSEITV